MCVSLQTLCNKGANVLQTKSLVVEEAATELIAMLLHIEELQEEEPEEVGFTDTVTYTGYNQCVIGCGSQ